MSDFEFSVKAFNSLASLIQAIIDCLDNKFSIESQQLLKDVIKTHDDLNLLVTGDYRIRFSRYWNIDNKTMVYQSMRLVYMGDGIPNTIIFRKFVY